MIHSIFVYNSVDMLSFFFDGYVVMLIMMLKLDECGILEYFLVYSRTRLTHLQFVDEIILFSRASSIDPQSPKLFFLVLERISELKMSLGEEYFVGHQYES